MKRMIERRVEPTEASNLMAMAIMLFTMPRPVENVDAIVLLPGQGEDWRIHDAVRAWNTNPTVRYFLVAGNCPDEETWFLPTVEILRQKYGLTRTDGTIIIEHSAEHTKVQADWLIPLVRQLDITSFALTASPYHLLRAYSAMLAAFKRHEVQWIPMIPLPTVVSPGQIVPETGLTGWDMVHGEVARIIKYRDLGDIPTPQEFSDYLRWLWRQPILAQTPCPHI